MDQAQDIRDKYLETIRSISADHPTADIESAYLIPADATFAQCLGYTQKYIVGEINDEPHYRYDIYRSALQEIPFNLENAERLVHVDVGCGPGLFTWVLRDYFRAHSGIALELHGYDHSREMEALATSIWSRLGEDAAYACHYQLDELLSTATLVRPDTCSVLVTFGHVLIQTMDDESAVNDFTTIIETFAALGDCQILAVDARMLWQREAFRKACKNLAVVIKQRGMTLTGWDISSFGSRMLARIGAKE